MKAMMKFAVVCSLTFSALPAFAQMDQPEFSRLGKSSVERCVTAVDKKYCDDELLFARQNNLITQTAYDWGKANDYYPVISRNNRIGAVCKCGCFDEATTILMTPMGKTEASYLPIKQLTSKDQVMALEADATLSDLRMSSFPVKSITRGPEAYALYVFHLANGYTLKVTQHHGMVLADGRMLAAKDVTTQDSFIAADTGDIVAIKSITREKTRKDVHNFTVDGREKLNHIVAAEGVLVGEIAWQNSLARELGSIQIRQ